jgi:acyl carrier protein
MPQTKSTLRQFIRDNFILGNQAMNFADSESFMELHILDSTGFLELVSHLEEQYGIMVEDEEMIPENLDSLDALHAFLMRKRAA